MENAGTTIETLTGPHRVLTARDAGYFGCPHCGRVHSIPAPAQCIRCGLALDASKPDVSLQWVWAWFFAGLIAYIPANLYPMLLTSQLGHTSESTILEGVVDLIHYGSYSVAIIVFVASILIPVGKFFAIAYLALSIQRKVKQGVHNRHKLFEVVEFIGRWSMIDVFVVAILAALVQLDFAASINPGVAAISFALSVAFTMLSAQSFNPKSIWAAGDTSES